APCSDGSVGDLAVRIRDRRAVDTDRDAAPAAECGQYFTFGFDGEARCGVVELGDGGADGVVALGRGEDGVGGSAGFEGEGALAGRGAELVNIETLVDGFGTVEAVESGGGEDQRIALAFGELAQAGVDVAAKFDELDVGAEGEDLRAAAGAGGADAGGDGQRVERPELLADEGVARVGATGDGGEREARVEFGGQVFQRVDGEVDLARGEGLFDFLDEDAFGEGRFFI